ncbi:MAG: hypothetical protein NC429_08600 [Lachnospiraceae bacterium]|nr:hypothetical protein [Lachnospiraceae bacterium]
MADKKTNDFWGNNDDDFWNKPVITGDWLNSGTPRTENPEPQNPYGNTENYYADGNKEPYGTENPEQTGNQGEPVYGIPNQPANQSTYQSSYQSAYNYQEQKNKPGRRIKEKDVGEKKAFPIFTVINLSFLALALIVVFVCILGAGKFRDRADRRNRTLDYERVVAEGDSFPVYDNNTVILAWDAQVIFGGDTEKQLLGMPEGEMLIALPVQVESDKYISSQYALRDMFIGCDIEGQRVFRRCVRDETILAALGVMGFRQEEMSSSYGIGNGNDESVFFFFFVPEGTREITFYAEERRTEQKISMLTRRYEKNLVISDNTDSTEWLEEVRESEGWQ